MTSFRKPPIKPLNDSIDLNKSISDKRKVYFILYFSIFYFYSIFQCALYFTFAFFHLFTGLVITLKNSGGS